MAGRFGKWVAGKFPRAAVKIKRWRSRAAYSRRMRKLEAEYDKRALEGNPSFVAKKMYKEAVAATFLGPDGQRREIERCANIWVNCAREALEGMLKKKEIGPKSYLQRLAEVSRDEKKLTREGFRKAGLSGEE